MKFWLLTWPWNQVRKLAMLEDYFEEEQEQQQQPALAEVAITNSGQRNQPTALLSGVLEAKERAQCARCDMDLCVVCRFVEYHTKVNS